MSIYSSIPASYPSSFRRGARHVGVWAIQRVLIARGVSLIADGDYGPKTERAVSAYQREANLIVDGVAGQHTQRRLSMSAISLTDGGHDLPGGLLRSIVQGESNYAIGAVAWWTPGGVDCGWTQTRVYDQGGVGADFWRSNVDARTGRPSPALLAAVRFDPEAIRRAFDPPYTLLQVGQTLRSLHDKFEARLGDHELAWRCAVLDHNYPWAAEQVSLGRASSISRRAASWVPAVKFTDGTPVRSPWDWCCYYALGSEAHRTKGEMVSLVRRWTA